MNKKLKVAQIGFGAIGRVHAAQYADQPDCQLVAIVDICPSQFRGIASVLGKELARRVKRYATFEEMMERERPDMVDICLPTDLHEKMAIQAMRAGCHVLCEKPMARSLEEADRMMAVAKEPGRKLMIAKSIISQASPNMADTVTPHIASQSEYCKIL